MMEMLNKYKAFCILMSYKNAIKFSVKLQTKKYISYLKALKFIIKPGCPYTREEGKFAFIVGK